jgi:hypothetical protein
MRGFPKDERVVFRERYVFSHRPGVYLFLLVEAIIWTLIAINGWDTNALIALLAGTGIGILVPVWLELGARQVWFIVGERTVKFGRVRAFPASAVREFEPVDGKVAIKRVRDRLMGNTTAWNMRTKPNPNVKGTLAPKWVDQAVLVQADPSIGPTHTFLIGTRHQQELLDALREVAHGGETAVA